jgi:phenylacetate-CoA ligase
MSENLSYGAERLGCTVIPMSGGQTERQAQLIRDAGVKAGPSGSFEALDGKVRRVVDKRTAR